MTESEALTLHMLRQIDQKLDRLLRELPGEKSSGLPDGDSLSECANKIAAMTPRGVRQTNAVELLHEDRRR